MKRTEIEVGGEYAVYVGGLTPPPRGGYRTGSGQIKSTHAQVGSVPTKKRYQHDEDCVRGRVAAFDAQRVSMGRWHYQTTSDGVLIEFPEPITLGARYGSDSGKVVKTAVVTTKHILEPWAARVGRLDTWEQERRERAAEVDRQAAEFDPVLMHTVELVRAALGQGSLGVDLGQHAIYFDGGKLPLAGGEGSDGQYKATGFARRAEIESATLLALIERAASPPVTVKA